MDFRGEAHPYPLEEEALFLQLAAAGYLWAEEAAYSLEAVPVYLLAAAADRLQEVRVGSQLAVEVVVSKFL